MLAVKHSQARPAHAGKSAWAPCSRTELSRNERDLRTSSNYTSSDSSTVQSNSGPDTPLLANPGSPAMAEGSGQQAGVCIGSANLVRLYTTRSVPHIRQTLTPYHTHRSQGPGTRFRAGRQNRRRRRLAQHQEQRARQSDTPLPACVVSCVHAEGSIEKGRPPFFPRRIRQRNIKQYSS